MLDRDITFEEALIQSGLAAKLEARGEVRGVLKGTTQGADRALELIEQGYTPDQIRQKIASETRAAVAD